MSQSPTDRQPRTTTKRRRSGKYAGKSASAREQERKQKLLAAGIHLIGSQGYATTSIDAICAEAGLTKRYFYEAFASREELLIASYEAANRQFLQTITLAATAHLSDAKQMVRAGLESTFDWVSSHPDEARLIMLEAMTVRSQIGRVYGERYDAFVEMLVSFTRPFLPADGPADTTLKILARSALGAIIHLCQGWIATGFRQPAGELVDGMELIFSGLARELGIRHWAD